MRPTINIRIDPLSDEPSRITVLADTPEDRDMAHGWLTRIMVQIELLEAGLKEAVKGDKGDQP